MESFFFNITEQRYQITPLFHQDKEHITRVDISNGVVFLDVALHHSDPLHFVVNNLDRMVLIPVVMKGTLTIKDNIENNLHVNRADSVSIYASSRQKMTLSTASHEPTQLFILFIADFFLKRYLSAHPDEPIDMLYQTLQQDVSLVSLTTQAVDALSLYIMSKIINAQHHTNMHSLRCEHSVIEFLIHRLSLYDNIRENISDEELCISRRAKDILLQSFANPPTIPTLAHLCATNESKLKKVFKKVYNTTINCYIQKLRLEEANLLLKEQSLTIGEISNIVGYKHQGHFSKLFFTTYGVYPKDLLKR